MVERTFRSLTSLTSASTSRVLNLHAISERILTGEVGATRVLFSSPALNTSIIMKHRMRPDDLDLMPRRKPVCTKVIVPFDRVDLRAGGKSLFVGQHKFKETLRDVGQYREGHDIDHDVRVLELLDSLPSLDPFLLREKLRSHGVVPDPRYFAISPGDQQRMFQYTATELNRLTNLAGGNENATGRMVAALLSTDVDEKLEPLRATLCLSAEEFKEGVFSWRGFIYYKWCLAEVWPRLISCLKDLKSLQPIGSCNRIQKNELAAARHCILSAAKRNSDEVRTLLQVYEDAYNSLLCGLDPRQFRKFLLDAPALFLQIGEKMGTLSHITSFWRFRFPDQARAAVTVEDLIVVLHDFSRAFADSKPARANRPPGREALDQLLTSATVEPCIILTEDTDSKQTDNLYITV